MRASWPLLAFLLAVSVSAIDRDGAEECDPASLTLWDVGFSLWDKWAALRDDPCPAPTLPEQQADEISVPKEEETPEDGERDIVSFEDWRRLRDPVVPVQLRDEDLEEKDSAPVADCATYPLNKYNYASPDCSARVLSSSTSTQHSSSLLHKSRDRYMLTPCKADEHWVVVELCDEIRIQAIEVAIWEFFSGIVRDIKVSVGSDDGEDTSWTAVESFVGKNIRGAQVRLLSAELSQTFVLSQPTAFHRFLRIDFMSHYGSEYYCPVSHLKVFGMNQMEAFKFEQRRVTPKEDKEIRMTEPEQSEVPVTNDLGNATIDNWASPELEAIERLVQAQASLQPNESSVPSDMPDAINSSTTEIPKSKSDSSESIYAFIVRRLDALEGNSSLVARYVDEQSRSIKTLLRESAAKEELSRANAELVLGLQWEQERMRQEERVGRILSQLETQRGAMEAHRRDIQSQLRLLADELSHERRRGLAQLFLLLIVIGLGVASRSSAIDAVLAPLLAGHRTGHPQEALSRVRSLSRAGSKRPPTPTALRKKGGFRSVSSIDLIPIPRAAPRRMARTAHLHVFGGPQHADSKEPVDHPHGDWEDQQTEASVSDVEQEII